MADKLPVIIDNRGDNTVLRALQRLLPNLRQRDVATGVFEVGSFLLLEGLWRDLDRIRILMGHETTRTTKKVIVEALHAKLIEGKGEYKGSAPEDVDEYRAENVFFVPPTARWSYLHSRPKLPSIGKELKTANVRFLFGRRTAFNL